MIHILIGTKAQLIKMAPIMRELQIRGIAYNFISSGQHNETMEDIRANFGIKSPDTTLYSGPDITATLQIVTWFIKTLMVGFFHRKKIFKNDKNGIILNHGDTFSALLGTILGKTVGLKTGHIESGLRSFKMFHPFPEEITRLLIFKMTDYFFCPSEWAAKNIHTTKGRVINTKNNTLYDALQNSTSFTQYVETPEGAFAIATIHRYENIFNKAQLAKVLAIIEKIAEKIQVLFIMHPPTKKNLLKYGFYDRLSRNKNIELRPRYDYFRFISLLKKAEFVISDGGSNQEECFYLGKPCLLLRYATERPEGLGENIVLSEFDQEKISNFVKNYRQHGRKRFTSERSPSRMIIDILDQKGLTHLTR